MIHEGMNWIEIVFWDVFDGRSNLTTLIIPQMLKKAEWLVAICSSGGQIKSLWLVIPEILKLPDGW
jgi:hypothetical protein